jgi:pilus assembly protein FimV
MKRVFRISSLLAALLLISGEVLAAGMGRMSVSSALGQPLRAEIELLSIQPEDVGTVEAKLADIDAYRQAHIDRSSVLSDLHFDIEKRSNGQPVIRITSSAPVTEPFVDLLVELNWNSGRVLREYTLLLDPPKETKPSAEQKVMAPSVSSESGQVPQPHSTPAATPMAKAKPAAAAGNAGQGSTTYGPVKAGETLRSIASKLLPSDVSMDMMLASLYQTNQSAFAQKNMNLLKKGRVLSVPDRNSIMLMYSPPQARKLVQEQTSAWHDIENRIAGQAQSVAATTQSAESGKIMPAQPPAKPGAPSTSQDVLKLSKGEPVKTAAETAKHVRDLEDAVAAKDRELQDAQSRVGQLEKTVQDLQRLMDLKKQQGESAAAKPAAPPVEAPKPAAEAPKPVMKPAVKPPVMVQPTPEQPGFLSSLLSKPLIVFGGLAALVLGGILWVFVIGKRRRQGLSSFEQSIMTGGDQFRTSIFKTTSGGKTERAASTQSGSNTDFSRLGLGSIDTHEVDPIAEAEVYMAYGRDAQAEEILKEALSKEPQRHELALKLLEIYAARQDTSSFETQASELYAALDNPSDSTWHKAAEMGRSIDPENPLYQMHGETTKPHEEQVDALAESGVGGFEVPASMEPAAKHEFVPEPLAELEGAPMADSLPDAGQEEKLTDESHGLDFDFAPEVEPEPVSEIETEPVPVEEHGMDLDFKPEEMVEAPARQGIEFEEAAAAKEFPAFGVAALDEIDIAAPAVVPEDLHPFEHAEELGDLELAFAELEQKPVEQPVAEIDDAVKLPDLDFSGIDLELSESPAVVAEPEMTEAATEIEVPSIIDPDLLEEVNTKLDLAKAYLEMGDKEGAREILGEVLAEGDAQQKQSANDLMAEIG